MIHKEITVKNWDNIEVHYRWTLKDGSQFDSSYDRWQTLPFKVWAWQMIKWFDVWVVGMKIWEKKTLELEANEAYWEYDHSKKQTIRKKDLASFSAAWYELKVWENLPTQYWELEIIDSNEENVILDLNHKLAWKKLIFEVELVKIK